MSQGSTIRWAQAASRIAVRGAGKNRWVRAFYSGASTTLRSFARVLHLLFLQVTGVFFLAFALLGGLACAREYRIYASGQPVGAKVAVAAAFSLMFLWFAVSSFWRASKKGSQ